MKLIKSIDTHRYLVELLQLINDTYVISYESKVCGVPSKSEVIKDYGIAAFLFDLKVEELEGN